MTSLDVLRRSVGSHLAPKRASPRLRLPLGLVLFLVIVVAPVVGAGGYYGIVASDRYVSEVHFIVRSQSTPQLTGLSMFLSTFGLSRSDDDSAAVQTYIESRDALRDLMDTLPMGAILDRPEADVLARCAKPWSRDTFEQLYRCYQRRVRVIRYSDRGITHLVVDLFRPEDARAVAAELIRRGEALANRINTRAEEDAVDRVDALLASAQQRLLTSQAELTQFRSENRLVDIEGSATPIDASISGLISQIVATRVEIEELRQTAPGNPRIPPLVERLAVLEEQLREEQQRLAGGPEALANRIADYEFLVLRRELAEESVELASQAMDKAIEDANRQRIYVERVSGPNLPDAPTRPRRIRAVATVALVALFVYGMVWLLMVGSREHLDRA